MNRSALVLLYIAGLLVTGCGEKTPAKTTNDPKPCVVADDCESGERCVDGTCKVVVTVAPACGDGVVNRPGELCDGDDLGGLSCEAVGASGGALGCHRDCTLDLSGCDGGPSCGDGIRSPYEPCEGDDVGQRSCQTEGFDTGRLRCTDTCTLDTSGCAAATCGNDTAEGLEPCDGDDLRGLDCARLGFTGGTLACADCELTTEGCTGTGPSCGDGVAEGLEACDGDDLRLATCASVGLSGGDPRVYERLRAVDARVRRRGLLWRRRGDGRRAV